MNYIKLPWLDDRVSVYDIAQAHMQLEADYNVGGWVRERPSNKRRMESTSCQLSRIGYDEVHRWVDICNPKEIDSGDDQAVRDIYLMNVLQWGLPIDAEMMACIKARYTRAFLKAFPQCKGVEYRPGAEVPA